MRRTVGSLMCAVVLIAGAWRPVGAQRAADDVRRVQDAVQVLRDLTAQPDDRIPQYLLDRAEAIVVIPNMIRGGFVVGAKHGKGIISARERSTGRWSPPSFVEMTGGSVGWQIGAQSVDLVLLVMNDEGVRRVLDDRFTLGGDLSIAAGPIGRSASAATDLRLESQILAYSRAKGLFAGATLEGVSLRPDREANEDFYGRELDARDILLDRAPNTRAPMVAQNWVSALESLTNGADRRDRADDSRTPPRWDDARNAPRSGGVVPPPGYTGTLVNLSELVKHPKDYYGKQVLVDGAVEDVYSRTVFAIDDDRVLTTGRGVIVVAPTLRRPIVDRADLTVAGDLIKFDKGDIEDRFKDYDLDLPSDLAKRFKDQPVIVATSIRTKDGEELVGPRVIK